MSPKDEGNCRLPTSARGFFCRTSVRDRSGNPETRAAIQTTSRPKWVIRVGVGTSVACFDPARNAAVPGVFDVNRDQCQPAV